MISMAKRVNNKFLRKSIKVTDTSTEHLHWEFKHPFRLFAVHLSHNGGFVAGDSMIKFVISTEYRTSLGGPGGVGNIIYDFHSRYENTSGLGDNKSFTVYEFPRGYLVESGKLSAIIKNDMAATVDFGVQIEIELYTDKYVTG